MAVAIYVESKVISMYLSSIAASLANPVPFVTSLYSDGIIDKLVYRGIVDLVSSQTKYDIAVRIIMAVENKLELSPDEKDRESIFYTLIGKLKDHALHEIAKSMEERFINMKDDFSILKLSVEQSQHKPHMCSIMEQQQLLHMPKSNMLISPPETFVGPLLSSRLRDEMMPCTNSHNKSSGYNSYRSDLSSLNTDKSSFSYFDGSPIPSPVYCGLAPTVGTMRTVQTLVEHSPFQESLEKREVFEIIPCHGTFIWKIPEISRRYRDAQERRILSLYSPLFRPFPYGYEMRINAYLNGYGAGKGTHISLYIQLLEGENDDVLSWPFAHPVTLQLLNRDNSYMKASETIIPKVTQHSFRKPDKFEANVPIGFSCFVEQTVLNEGKFVEGDSLYICCKVHHKLHTN
jgi:hypothetical protein